MRRKKVLFLTARPPYPLDTGAKIRTWHILSGYADRFDVDVLHFSDPGVDEKWTAVAKHIGVCGVYSVENPGMNQPATLAQFATAVLKDLPVSSVKYIRKDFSNQFKKMVAQGYDVVHVDTIHLAGGVASLKQLPGPPLTILNAHNVECQIARRMRDLESSLPRRMALSIHARNMERFERRAFALADMVLAVSEEDRGRIDAMARVSGKATLVENGVDENYFTPGMDQEIDSNSLVFVGSMDWRPNVDGVKWFVSEILPLIRQQHPQAMLTIVGRSPHAEVADLHSPGQGVVVTGTVDDVRPYVRIASVVVVPLRFGGGTRLKILEAFAMKKAVVSTSLGAEGIQCLNGKHLYIENKSQAFAHACLKLMRNDANRHDLGENGRNLALSQYSWSSVIKRMYEGRFWDYIRYNLN
jgi:sugar transferase (PEP-CTERM/EpsH1 system associated)